MNIVGFKKIYKKENLDKIEDMDPSFVNRIIEQDMEFEKKELLEHSCVSYEVKNDALIDSGEKLTKQNIRLLTAAMILFPLVIPSIIMLLVILANQNKIEAIKNELVHVNKQDYHGGYLYQMSQTNFKLPISDTYEGGKHQFIADVLRGLQIEGNDFRYLSSAILNDSEIDYLFHRLIDGLDVSNDMLRSSTTDIVVNIQKRVNEIVRSQSSEFLDEFLSYEIIKNVLTDERFFLEIKSVKQIYYRAETIEEKKEKNVFRNVKERMAAVLLNGMINEPMSPKLIKHFFSELSEKQVETLIRGHHQTMMTAAQQLIDFTKLLSAGYVLEQNYVTNIYRNEETGKIHYNVTKPKIEFNKCSGDNMGEKTTIPGFLEMEYILEDDGFVLNNIIISDSNLEKLVFSKTENEMRDVLENTYGMQVER